MNMKQYLLSLGVDKAIELYEEQGFKNLGEYLSSILGEPVGSYGIMNGGILFDEDTWRKLENIRVEEEGR